MVDHLDLSDLMSQVMATPVVNSKELHWPLLRVSNPYVVRSKVGAAHESKSSRDPLSEPGELTRPSLSTRSRVRNCAVGTRAKRHLFDSQDDGLASHDHLRGGLH